MGINYELPKELLGKDTFTRREFEEAMAAEFSMTGPQSAYSLQKRLDDGSLVRMGWNQYSQPARRTYEHQYSDRAVEIVDRIKKDYTELEFQIFELIQLNDFMNHQVAHNTIFVSIENDLVDFVFESLWKEYPGKVMLKPSIDQYYRYLQDDEIVVGRLPSESPKGYDEPWKSRLEKILVDMITDKLMSGIVPDGEKPAIINGAFEDYMVDQKTMIRYAKRKGAADKVVQTLTEYGRMGVQ